MISTIVKNQREFFKTKKTLDFNFRLKQLDLLANQIKVAEDEILRAVKLDLNKAEFETYATEITLVKEEINYMKKNLKSLTKVKKHKSPLMHFPSKSYTYYDPYGIVLIMSPWNYPFQLAIAPLVGAIAAGNCAVIKPSNYSKNTSMIIKKILSVFDEEYIAVIEGGRVENQALLEQRFDFIFFTGSPSVGKLVMEKASRYLTPVTLELGGKSPCIVEKSANLDLAVKRIIWGKLLNSGQTCVAPDYLLVDENNKEELIVLLKKYIKEFYGEIPIQNEEYPKIINKNHFDRLCALIPMEKLNCNEKTLQIAPAILENTTWDSKIMLDEIFGPILPIITYKTIDEVIEKINEREKPLALYLFTKDKEVEKKVLKEAFFGGGCINDTIIHVANHHLPFSGVGNSGMNEYHGKASFTLFSHTKSIMKKSNLIDINIRYAPYKNKIKILKWF